MQDLDFEELDRAVNSLNMNKTNPSNPSAATSVVPTPSMPVISQTPVSVTPPIERPTTGRFMDVVHPSSNMRSNTPVIPERPNPQIIQTPVLKPVLNTPQPVKPKDLDLEKINSDINRTLNQQPANNVADSPFLPDAKVDKRPLGAFSTEPKIIQDKEIIDSDNKLDTTHSTMNINNTPLPAELDDALLLIESGSSTNPEMEILKVDKPVFEKVPEIKPEISKEVTKPTSIVQQYTEKPNSGDQKNGAIYDTNSYHKVITRLPKKKSGWMWIIWIVLLLIAGAGAGVAFYFFVMPNLPKF